MTETEEQNIIDRVIAGNASAFAVLVNHYKDMTVLLAYNILLNQEDAEETAQDSFIRAFTNLYSFKRDARFSTWLYRIVVNTALNRRRVKRHQTMELTDVVSAEVDNEPGDFLTFEVIAEHRRHIQHALRSISDKERLCITLHYLNELSVAEVSELTGISISNVKVLLHRGRKNLYTALHSYLKTEINNLINQS